MRKSRQKIKKMGCLRVSRRKKSKNRAAGTPARLKIKKTGLLELQQGQKSKRTVVSKKVCKLFILKNQSC